MFVLTLNFGGESKSIYLVIWDEKCSFCKSTIGLLSKVDYLDKLLFLPNSDIEALENYGITKEHSQSAMQVVDKSSNIVYSGFYGFRRISLVLVPFAALFPILSIPIIEKLGVKTYNYVALRRSCRL
jgi:predicted DCC family thiol-disulfide oxidoreductase YuxK